MSSLDHEAATFAPTGGSRLSREELIELQQRLRAMMVDTSARRFDLEATKYLTENLEMSAHEAAQPGGWAFLTLVVVPDVVRWRFHGADSGPTNADRYLGRSRGLRNTLGRLWWRGLVLRDLGNANPYWIIESLDEDQFVQLMERPAISGRPQVARALGGELARRHPPSAEKRELIFRETIKRVRRLAGILEFGALDMEGLLRVIADAMDETERSLH